MIRLYADYPATLAILTLPEAQLGDSTALGDQIQTIRMMDGSIKTHVRKRPNNRTYVLDFDVPREKVIQVQEFIENYLGKKIGVFRDDHDDFVGYLKINPFNYEMQKRAIAAGSNEIAQITLEFESVELIS